MNSRLENKNAFVVGGSSGIGAATVRALADAGARVAVGYFSGEKRAQDLLSNMPGEGHFAVKIDVTDSRSVLGAAEKLAEIFGSLNILVNSGGKTKYIPHNDLIALSDELFDEVMQTNVRGVFSTIRACHPLLVASGSAVIVNISSVAGTRGNGSNVAYSASKGAIDTMTISLALALAPDIRVMSVAPGAVDTEIIPGVDKKKLYDIAEAEP